MINNRQNGRRRGRGGQRVGSGGGNPGQPNGGSRIDNRARGNANQLYEKYKTLARDAQMQGDRVNTEYYLQFADHYFRVLSENRPRFEEQRGRQRDDFDDDFDGAEGDEFGVEGEPVRAEQYQPQADRQRVDRQRGDGHSDRAERSERPDRDERRPQRAEGDRAERSARADRPRPEGEERRPRNGQSAAAPHRDAAENTDPVEPVAITQPHPATEEASAPHMADMEAPQPRRRGRPRRERAEELAPVETFEADRLPPSLSLSASAEPDTAPAAGSGDGEGEKPRRRRRAIAAVDVTPAG